MKPLGFNFEKKILSNGYSFVAGCDEVGRGALAGPIVAAAVIWNAECRIENEELSKVQDSKLLKASEREILAFHIKHHVLAWSIVEVSPQVIDKINIHQANLLALHRVLVKLHVQLGYNKNLLRILKPASSASTDVAKRREGCELVSADRATGDKHVQTHVAVDGRFLVPGWRGSQEAVVGGDGKIFSIAAASILAKVYRDRLMMKQESKFPGYGFSNHKGYGTEEHRQAIVRQGLASIHRRSFCSKIIDLE